MEKILSIFRKQQEEQRQVALENQYFTWNSPFESETDRHSIWHTEFGFDRERHIEQGQDHHEITLGIVNEFQTECEPNGLEVTDNQQPILSQPNCNDNGDLITTEGFTYSQFGTEGTEEDVDQIHVPTCTRILLIVGMVICKPFGQNMFENYFLSRYFEYHGEWEEAARRLRLARIWGVVTYVSFVLYMAFLVGIVFLSM